MAAKMDGTWRNCHRNSRPLRRQNRDILFCHPCINDRIFSGLFQRIKYCYLWLTIVFIMDVNKLMFALALVLLVAWIAGATP